MNRAYAAPRRALLAALGVLLAAPLSSHNAQAAWPERPITVVVPYTPGTSMDTLARTISPKLAQSLGQPVVVENRPGASGNIGTGYVANAAADGYTLLMTVSTFVMNPSLFKSVPYEPVKSFAPIGQVATGALVFAVNPTFPASTLSDAIKDFRANPGKVTYASPGTGTPQHLAMELFKLHAGVDLLHVPYSGGGPAVQAVVGGQSTMTWLSYAAVRGQLQAGRMKALAVAGDKRLPDLPHVPTLIESGYPGFVAYSWSGMFAPAGTPAPVVARLTKVFQTVLADPQVKKQLTEAGFEIVASDGPALDAYVKQEFQRWDAFIKANKINLDN